jgi:N,N-dimethylformamidase
VTQIRTKHVLGYCDPWSVVVGERVSLHVSSERSDEFHLEIVRVEGDIDDVDSSERPIPHPASGTYPAHARDLPSGSYAVISDSPAWDLRDGWELSLFIKPTTPDLGKPQAIVSRGAGDHGLWLGMLSDGRIALRLGDRVLAAATPLRGYAWYSVVARWSDRHDGSLSVRPVGRWSERPQETSGRSRYEPAAGPILLAAAIGDDGTVGQHFNGCLARVELNDAGGRLIGSWDMSADHQSALLPGGGSAKQAAHLVNAPTRSIPGPSWDGTVHAPSQDPAHYDAVHFHVDDLEDAGWPADVSIETDVLKSGVYAARLTSAGETTTVPFFVRSPRDRRRPLAFLASTASYLAYGNSSMPTTSPIDEISSQSTPLLGPIAATLAQRADVAPSLYDVHTDGSPSYVVSRRRPILNHTTRGYRWVLGADLDIIALLERSNIEYDVITDEDVHREGADALAGYRCVLTGAHPEYISTEMWDGLVDFLGHGGRLVYLGGNGFYWRVSHPADRPWLMECRRAEIGARYTEADMGSYYHQFGGQYGGLWRNVGRRPQELVGVGMAGDGWDDGAPYWFNDEARDPRVSFIVDGIDLDQPLGAHGKFGKGGGAAGAEIDRADFALGTPPHAVIVASSGPHSASYFQAPEETSFLHAANSGDVAPMLRADLVFFETPGGGAVVSTGSIAWAASLPTNHYDNDVARLTRNVIQRFIDAEPFTAPW